MRQIISTTLLATTAVLLATLPSPAVPALKITVNSNGDTIQRDQVITLREAIALTNGTLNADKLTREEKAQVLRPIRVNDRDRYSDRPRSIIRFELSSDQTIIQLESALPPIQTDGTIIDATSQLTENNQPSITLYANPQQAVQRGLWIQADGVMIRGLSLIGFGNTALQAYREPTGNIVVGQWETNDAPERVVKDIVIAQNWLGRSSQLVPSADQPQSGFGLYIFNAAQIQVHDNWIVDNRASGIITGKTATNLDIHRNQINNNGVRGMADGIRLEGDVSQTNIRSNEIYDNSGSGIYLFKTQGQVSVTGNQITNAVGDRAAIYLMGNDHRVESNRIRSAGSGVIISAYPRSRRNKISQNQFQVNNGLSIDLVSQRHVGVQDYYVGDGRNQPAAQYPSQWDFANGGIDAPQFLSREFIIGLDGQVEVIGQAQPDAQIELYRTQKNQQQKPVLATPLMVVQSDSNGRFQATLGNLKPGDRVSATVTHPDYGTSEASRSSVIRKVD